MVKRVSIQRVKIHRQYTYDTAADAVGVTTQTVRVWRTDGLHVMDSQKPHLILGSDLKQFIQNRMPKASCSLAQYEFYCMSCRAPKRAYGFMADYIPLNDTRGMLKTLCETCQKPCNKFATLQDCDDLAAIIINATHHTC